MQAVFNPADPAFTADRYATYRTLRDNAPVAPIEVNGHEAFVVTRYTDASRIFKTPSARVQPHAGQFPQHIGTGPASEFYRLSLPSMDAPSHTRLRKLAGAAFSARAVATLRSRVQEIIDNGIDRISDNKGEFDFVAEFAARVPAEIACRLLHAPMSEAHTVLERMPDLNAVLSHGGITPEKLAAADAAAQFYIDYIGDLVDTLRGKLDADDPVGALLEAEEDGSRMTRIELVITLVGFFVASYHTTLVAMTNAVYALSTHPEQMNILRANPDLAGQAWEEVLRYLSPVHFIHRYAGQAQTLHGVDIPEGGQILLGLAAANRDERFIDDPDTFDIERETNRHLAFTAGGHFCLGAPLSRLEGHHLLRTLPARVPNLRVTIDKPDWGPDLSFAFMRSMTVAAE
ncbi:cytochrome P450 [Nocardia panacis]|uniref:Cytochrome P450 n=1 Tax=Nocardia panacis TaxID=2340916 RepID=A0A3A4JPP7_9NOCA|nr:cytochrome P450 [Nocardia panacis]RJO71018.1 cytochrome P450 [Nocardia panacis]